MAKKQKSFLLDEDTITTLETYAKKQNVSQTEILRQAVRQYKANAVVNDDSTEDVLTVQQAHIKDLQEQVKTLSESLRAQQVLCATIANNNNQPKLRQGFFSRLFNKSSDSQNTSS